jgi:ribonuclease HI
MNSTHNMSLEVLAGVLPLQNRFWELSLRILIKCGVSNTLVIEQFEEILGLNTQSRYMRIYHYYISTDMCLPLSIPDRAHFTNSSSSIEFDLSMKPATSWIPDQLRSIIIPRIFSEKYQHINCSKRFFTDGSRLNESTGFGVFHENSSAFRKLLEPCSVYVAELAAIFFALGMISNMPVDHYFIFSDSLSSIEAIRSVKPGKHASYFLSKIREQMSALVERSYKITLAWVPSHCAIPGNEKADSLAKVGAQEGEVFDRRISPDEFYRLVRQSTLSSWQNDWDTDDLGRWLHSIIPNVCARSWFKGLDVSRDFIRVMSRLMSNHYSLNTHLHRINLVENNVCRCGNGYDDIDHAVWHCSDNYAAREHLLNTLEAQGRQPYVPVRDVLATRDLCYMQLIYVFLQMSDVKV